MKIIRECDTSFFHPVPCLFQLPHPACMHHGDSDPCFDSCSQHSIKSLVFSQFTVFLDLIERRLQLAGFKLARLQGNMTPEARDRTIKYFMNNNDVQVFLVSLKAGGVALNLTEASRVFIMDPWYGFPPLATPFFLHGI